MSAVELPRPWVVDDLGCRCGGSHPRTMFPTGTPGLATYYDPPAAQNPCGLDAVDIGWHLVHTRPGGGTVLYGYRTLGHAIAGAAALGELWDWSAHDDWPPIGPFLAHVEAMVEAGL